MSEETEMKCKLCKWFRSCGVDDNDPYHQWGRCHRNPPQFVAFRDDEGIPEDTGMFPSVDFDCFCGEFTPLKKS